MACAIIIDIRRLAPVAVDAAQHCVDIFISRCHHVQDIVAARRCVEQRISEMMRAEYLFVRLSKRKHSTKPGDFSIH